MTHSYDFWQNALQGNYGQLSEGDSHPGFWRRRMERAGRFYGVAIWPDADGNLVCVSNKKAADPVREFSYCVKHPVSEDAYRQWDEIGLWPDEAPEVSESLSPPPASIGGNNPPTDPLETLRDSIQAALGGVAEYAKVTSDEAAKKAQSLRSRLLELSGEADDKRSELVRPHLDAEKSINSKWMPLVKTSKAGADELRKAISAFETEEKRKRDAAEAERQKKLAEDAKKAAQAQAAAAAAGKPAPEPPPPQPAPEPAPAPSSTIRGAYGRAASKKLVKKARIVDYGKALVALSTHPEMRDLVEKLAQRAVTAGVMVEGVEFDEVVDVK